MNVEWYMARRLLKEGKGGFASVAIVKVAVAGIALGLCVMLLAVFVIAGFKREITRKLFGFTSHLNVLPLAEAGEGGCIRRGDTLVSWLEGLEGVEEAYGYVEKPAILKSRGEEGEIHGALLRGADAGRGLSFFREHLVEGELPDFTADTASNGILLSANAAGYLRVSPGDRLTAYFVDDPRRPRPFVVRGVYRTGFKEYDDVMALVDKRHLTRLNGWEAGDASGIAVALADPGRAREMAARITASLEETRGDCEARTLEEMAPQIFDWLKLLDMNVWIIVILLVTVAGFNMVSGLLILILDKTALIGILKALGCRDFSTRRLFLYIAAGLVARGMLWGNLLAFALGGVQYCFHVVALDPETYYMSTVPLFFNVWHVVLLNAGVMAVTVLVLVAPTMLVSRVDPVRSMRFE
ncbi:MAG: ABC transporter permease [Odoribacteraceae bacterium]|jgi:lipoprotein-releasing system permease protein|nr:ABC transporter permease [Odoribacteraceae bacterium]